MTNNQNQKEGGETGKMQPVSAQEKSDNNIGDSRETSKKEVSDDIRTQLETLQVDVESDQSIRWTKGDWTEYEKPYLGEPSYFGTTFTINGIETYFVVSKTGKHVGMLRKGIDTSYVQQTTMSLVPRSVADYVYDTRLRNAVMERDVTPTIERYIGEYALVSKGELHYLTRKDNPTYTIAVLQKQDSGSVKMLSYPLVHTDIGSSTLREFQSMQELEESLVKGSYFERSLEQRTKNARALAKVVAESLQKIVAGIPDLTVKAIFTPMQGKDHFQGVVSGWEIRWNLENTAQLQGKVWIDLDRKDPIIFEKNVYIADHLTQFTTDTFTTPSNERRRFPELRSFKDIDDFSFFIRKEFSYFAQKDLPAEEEFIVGGSVDKFSNSIVETFGATKNDVIRALNIFFRGRYLAESRTGQLLKDLFHSRWRVYDFNNVKKISDQFGYDFSTFDSENDIIQLIACMQLVGDVNFLEIVTFIKEGAIDNLGYSFEPTRSGDTVDAKRDISALRTLSIRFNREFNKYHEAHNYKYDGNEPRLSKEWVSSEWKKIQSEREHWIKNSTDMKNGAPVPIDLLVLGEVDSTVAHFQSKIPELVDVINAHPRQKGKGEFLGNLWAKDTSEFQKRLDQMPEKISKHKAEYESGERHLLVWFISHGSQEEGRNTLAYPVSLLEKLDPRYTSMVYDSCYGGRHLLDNERSWGSQKFVPVISPATNQATPTLPRQDVYDMFREAYEEEEEKTLVKNGREVKGTYKKADLNGDGIVNIAELHLWMDRNSIAQDPVVYDDKGNLIAVNQPENLMQKYMETVGEKGNRTELLQRQSREEGRPLPEEDAQAPRDSGQVLDREIFRLPEILGPYKIEKMGNSWILRERVAPERELARLYQKVREENTLQYQYLLYRSPQPDDFLRAYEGEFRSLKDAADALRTDRPLYRALVEHRVHANEHRTDFLKEIDPLIAEGILLEPILRNAPDQSFFGGERDNVRWHEVSGWYVKFIDNSTKEREIGDLGRIIIDTKSSLPFHYLYYEARSNGYKEYHFATAFDCVEGLKIIREKDIKPLIELADASSYVAAFADQLEQYFGIPRQKAIRAVNGVFEHPIVAESKSDSFYREIINLSELTTEEIADRWKKSAEIGKALDLDFSDVTAKDIDSITECMYLSEATYALEILNAMKQGKLGHLGFSFEQNRKKVDPAQDLSTIMILSRQLEKNPGRFDLGILKRDFLKLTKLREESFTKSEELRDGKQVPIDVVFIGEVDSVIASFSNDVPSLIDSLNRGPHQIDENGKPLGKMIDTLWATNHNELLTRFEEYKEIQRKPEYQNGQRHLVLYFLGHGKEDGSGCSLCEPGEVMEIMDPKISTLFYSSCFGGKQLLRIADKDSSRMRVNVFTSGSNVSIPIKHDQYTAELLKRAHHEVERTIVVKGRTVHKKCAAADINGDGMVTLGELRFWMDSVIQYQDPVSFDAHGNQITSTDSLKSEEALV